MPPFPGRIRMSQASNFAPLTDESSVIGGCPPAALLRQTVLLAALFVAFASTNVFAGTVTFTGSGNDLENNHAVSGTASFSISGDVLTIVLTNTTAGGTLAQGDALTGVAFDVSQPNPVPTLTLSSILRGT